MIQAEVATVVQAPYHRTLLIRILPKFVKQDLHDLELDFNTALLQKGVRIKLTRDDRKIYFTKY